MTEPKQTLTVTQTDIGKGTKDGRLMSFQHSSATNSRVDKSGISLIKGTQ